MSASKGLSQTEMISSKVFPAAFIADTESDFERLFIVDPRQINERHVN